MEKFTFEKEYELHASQRILFPYLTTPIGLAEWFADKVNSLGNNEFVFQWDGESQNAQLAAVKKDRFVRFVYKNKQEEASKPAFPPYYIEFHLENNELTDSTFLRVVDETGFDDLDELEDLWDGMVEDLRKKVGA